MKKISTDRPETFVEAVQLLFSYHCCLHLTGEPTSIGRLDQILQPFLPGTSGEDAQEIIDCLFVKLCEHVNVNSRLLNDLGAWGMTAVPYAATGMFPNGDGINQWVQQVSEFCTLSQLRFTLTCFFINTRESKYPHEKGDPSWEHFLNNNYQYLLVDALQQKGQFNLSRLPTSPTSYISSYLPFRLTLFKFSSSYPSCYLPSNVNYMLHHAMFLHLGTVKKPNYSLL